MPRHTAKKGCNNNNDCAISSPLPRHLLPTLGSVFTPIGRRKSARIANKRRRPLKMIKVCADVWLTIFAFFCPAEVGLKFALLSYGFNALVATHFKTRKWPMLAWLKIIDRSRMIKENFDADFNNYKMCGIFPIPKQPVPASLVGFNRIYILHIDHNVIGFLHRIRCLFNGGIGLSLSIWPEVPFSPNRCWNVFGQEIWPLLLPYISSFNIYGGHHFFSNLRHFISPMILRDCAHLRWVYASPSLDRLFPVLEHPADDGPEASPAQALFNGCTPRGRMGFRRAVETLKQTVVVARQPQQSTKVKSS
uniref:Uncharacterized protein n=1 Tax=Globodera rostochiensis TaxID=31243 RepID=A0A914H7J5_GLORO